MEQTDREPIVTKEELEQLPPRALVALATRCVERVEPFVKRVSSDSVLLGVFGDPVLSAKQFCDGKTEQFESKWRSCYVQYWQEDVGLYQTRQERPHELGTVQIIKELVYCIYALHYKRLDVIPVND